jgi:hypothetical protein
MRCGACGTELILTNVVPDETAHLPGCEHHTFICLGCHVMERRLVFTRHGREDDSVPMHMEAAPLVVPALSVQEASVATPGLLGRVVARLRGH